MKNQNEILTHFIHVASYFKNFFPASLAIVVTDEKRCLFSHPDAAIAPYYAVDAVLPDDCVAQQAMQAKEMICLSNELVTLRAFPIMDDAGGVHGSVIIGKNRQAELEMVQQLKLTGEAIHLVTQQTLAVAETCVKLVAAVSDSVITEKNTDGESSKRRKVMN